MDKIIQKALDEVIIKKMLETRKTAKFVSWKDAKKQLRKECLE